MIAKNNVLALDYERYLDAVLGGWIGKSIGGTIGARFEGDKTWIEIEPSKMFPEVVPPNDDLDLQVLWLKVLEEKGLALTSDDLAEAWLEGCYYPFNEFGVFRQNWKLGIHAPYCGSFGNQFFENGMGCPIRSEIWGYSFPGAPDLAAKFAEMDGILDHTEQSVGAEMMLSEMASMAFFVSDTRRLIDMFIGYLPKGTNVERQVRLALRCFDTGVSLRDARDRIMLMGGGSETTEVAVNVPFTFLALLYGRNDFEATLVAALNCGYDTDCTMATAGALLGQMLGAKGIPEYLKKPIGDELVMGIKYHREEMTLSALARDTARIGVLFAQQLETVAFQNAPSFAPFPATAIAPATRICVDYEGMPSAAPGETVRIRLRVDGDLPTGARLTIVPSHPGWVVVPSEVRPTQLQRSFEVSLHAPAMDAPEANPWPQQHFFKATLAGAQGDLAASYSFGVSGAALYQLLGVFYDANPAEGDFLKLPLLRSAHHFVSMQKNYLPEPSPDSAALYATVEGQLGRAPIVVSHERDVDVTRLIGLQGAYCVYLERTIIVPDDRDVFMIAGNSDSFRLYLNGEQLAEENETLMWSPFNNVYPCKLKKGANRILIKLLKRSDVCRFTLGMRDTKSPRFFHCNDWLIDLADVIPGQKIGAS